MNENKEKVSLLRAKLFELFEEQKKWQEQLKNASENKTLDDIRAMIAGAKKKIEKHRKIIEKCEKIKMERGENAHLGADWDTDSEFTTGHVVYNGAEPIDAYPIYSSEYSTKRIRHWEDEISKLTKQLNMVTIAQQQLDQLEKEITDIDTQIQQINNLCEQASEFLWPLYTETATDEDKRGFESHLKYLCEHKASASDIKNYIGQKEKKKIIRHKDYTEQYEIIKSLGVSFAKKTYLNA